MLEIKDESGNIRNYNDDIVYIKSHKPNDGFMNFTVRNALRARNQNLNYKTKESGKRPIILIMSYEYTIHEIMPELLKVEKELNDDGHVTKDKNIDLMIHTFTRKNFTEEYFDNIISSYNNNGYEVIMIMTDVFSTMIINNYYHLDILTDISYKYHIPIITGKQLPANK